MSDEPLSLADRITQAIDLLESITQQLHETSEPSVSQVLSATIELRWAVSRLHSARRHLGNAKEGPGLDVEPCGVPTCHCGCREKDPCRCAADE